VRERYIFDGIYSMLKAKQIVEEHKQITRRNNMSRKIEVEVAEAFGRFARNSDQTYSTS
jgi:hypothetical protein